MKYIKKYEELEDKSKITKLNLSYKNLTALPDLSEYISLKYLYCYNNKLTSLPELPNSLEILSCYNNKLTSLPELPKLLKYLDCDNNKLTSLPELPYTLERLQCDNNKLEFLPELPASLTILVCKGNNLPYNNLKEYKIWYAKTYPERIAAEKYNI